jgi:GrpB-like predicted nucleotidyltransferase (UPF0157 family)
MVSSNRGKPIFIADYDPEWQRMFDDERDRIYAACGRDPFTTIEHIGSTAVPGLAAKPIIDMMPGVRSLDDTPPIIKMLEAIGWVYVPEYERPTAIDEGMPFRRYLRKDRNGVRAFHMHMVEHGSDFWRDHLLFRNYLRTSHEHRDGYARIKRAIAADFNANLRPDSDVNVGYTDRKTAFVESVKEEARQRVARSAPIRVLPYDASWPEMFDQERARIIAAAGSADIDVQHVGSTSVPGLAAKPHVDIAIAVRTMEAGRALIEPLATVGYATGIRGDNTPDWIVLKRIDDGTDVAHVHVVPRDGWRWQRYIKFRDYLRGKPDARDAYAAVKQGLAAEYGSDHLGYTEAKTEFVREIYRAAGAPLYEETWVPPRR